eukprot:CAMPEP_0168277388 /NCGR_PEP_ID=MMETSP0141_2-20121125/19175_1 /TAXON_ID=44445 /ORGANISM="Pseudo-nitzschia australis, Strain 10249 10 AB" /LENGTH=405 /DNA_ID=CAMNT_0008219779 /DNA_START=135 /DNA_END=1349 /DNA_ORIENTATION=-
MNFVEGNHRHRNRNLNPRRQDQQNNETVQKGFDDSVGSQTNDVLDLFSTTLYSLAADADAIRQISDIADLTRVLSPSDERSNSGNRNDDDNDEGRAQIQKLCELDRIVSGVEKKVAALSKLINEENSALAKFETNLRQEAQEQDALIEELIVALDLKQQHQEQEQQQQLQTARGEEEELRFNDSGNVRHRHVHNDERRHDNRYESDNNNTLNHSGVSALRSSRSNNISRAALETRSTRIRGSDFHSSPHPSRTNSGRYTRDYNHESSFHETDIDLRGVEYRNNNTGENEHEKYSMDQRRENQDDDEHPSFVPVTEEELRDQIRFGPHLCRYDINQALEEIQQVVWKKIPFEYSINRNSSSAFGGNSHRVVSSNSLQRRFEYLRQRQEHLGPSFESETDAHAGYRW